MFRPCPSVLLLVCTASMVTGQVPRASSPGGQPVASTKLDANPSPRNRVSLGIGADFDGSGFAEGFKGSGHAEVPKLTDRSFGILARATAWNRNDPVVKPAE